MLPLLAIAGGMAALQGGLSMFGASSRNRQIRRSYQYNQQAAVAEMQQQARINEIQVLRTRQDASRAMGLVAVSAAERGVGMGGSTAALDRNIAIDADLNEYALEVERYGAEQRTLANLRLTNQGLAAQGQNVALAALTGAISGAQTGLSIGQGIEGLTSGVPVKPDSYVDYRAAGFPRPH